MLLCRRRCYLLLCSRRRRCRRSQHIPTHAPLSCPVPRPAEDQRKDLEAAVQKLTDEYVKQVRGLQGPMQLCTARILGRFGCGLLLRVLRSVRLPAFATCSSWGSTVAAAGSQRRQEPTRRLHRLQSVSSTRAIDSTPCSACADVAPPLSPLCRRWRCSSRARAMS